MSPGTTEDGTTACEGGSGRSDLCWERYQSYCRMLLTDPAVVEAHLGCAQCELKRESYAAARRHVHNALRAGGTGLRDAWYIRALTDVYCGHKRSARVAAERCAAIDPDNADVRALHEELGGQGTFGIRLFEADRFASSLPWLAIEARLAGPRSLAHFYHAVAKTVVTGRRKYVEAAACLAEKSLPPDLVQRNIGIGFIEIGRTTEGFTRLRQAIQMNPSAQNRVCLAANYATIGLDCEARQLCEQVLRGNPNHPGALFYMGLTCSDLSEALAFYGASHKHDPFESATYYHSGLVLARMKRIEEAVSEWEKAVNLDNADPSSIWTALGRGYRCLGQIAASRSCVKEALWFDPDSVPATIVMQDLEASYSD